MTPDPSQRKVGKIQEQYDLDGLDEQLRFKYTVEDYSLRELANDVNIEITRHVLGDKPFSPEHVYETLRDPHNTASKSAQSDLQRRLRLHGVDVDALEREWVTHMSVRSYLQSDLDVDTERDTRDPLEPDEALERIRGLLDREETIIRENFEATAGVDGSVWDLHQDLRLIHSETGESIRLEEYLQNLADDLE